MADKKLTMEELTQQIKDAEKNLENLNEQLKQQKKEAEEKRQAKLSAEREVRRKELEEAADNYQKLLRAFIKDYGVISIRTNPDGLSTIFDEHFGWWL